MEETITYCSMADYLGESTDCRVIYLEIDFHKINLATMLESAMLFYNSIIHLLGNEFIAIWFQNGKKVASNQMHDIVKVDQNRLNINFTANKKTQYVFDRTTMNKFGKSLKLGLAAGMVHTTVNYSLDFPDYYEEKITPYLVDKQATLDAIIQLFSESKKKTAFYNTFDAYGSFNGFSYEKNKTLYRGHMSFAIGIGCILGNKQLFVDKILAIMKEICSILISANARVGISPWPNGKYFSTHMKYFGKKCHQDGSHIHADCMPGEWYQYYYLCGVEWANYISPLSKEHLTMEQINELLTSNLYCEQYDTGGLLIKSKKSLMETEIVDLKQIKRYIYPALYPGESEFSLFLKFGETYPGWLPRANWEMVPMLNDEIDIHEGLAVFRHQIV